MKNKIRFAITALAIILFAACFFVACSDDVVSGKNNDHSYAEVLESNGAFAYMDKNYETFQDVIDAIAKTGAEGTISVLGNVKSRSVTIPENAQIFIDLGGHEIEFFDVESSAITIGAKAGLAAFNGTFTMADKKEDLSVINAAGNGSAVVLYENLTIKAAGQTALLLDAGSTVLDKDVVIEGSTIARGGKDQTGLMIQNNLSDVRMRGASLVVAGYGCVEITENVGDDNEFLVAPTATIIDKTGTIDPGIIEESICYIRRGTELVTFGSLKEAVASLVDKGETIVFITNETTLSEKDFTLDRPVTVDLNGFSAGTNNITLADGADLTIIGSAVNTIDYPSFTGTITSADGGVSSLILNGVVMHSDIVVSGSVSAVDCVFDSNGCISAEKGVCLENSDIESDAEDETALDIVSLNGDIVLINVTGEVGLISAPGKDHGLTINNSDSEYGLKTGAIVADADISVIGKSDNKVIVGKTVTGTALKAQYAIFGDDVVLSGDLIAKYSEFNDVVSANAVDDTGSVFHKDITAKGDISLINSTLQTIDAITSTAGGNITIKNSWGWVDAIETKAPEAEAEATKAGSIVIDNAEYAEVLSIGEIKATYDNGTDIYYGDISLIGNKENPVMKVYGSVTGKDIRADYCTFDTVDQVVSIVGNTVKVNCSVFETHFQETEYTNFYTIEATGEDKADDYALIIDSSSGRTGNIKATNGSVSASVSVEEGASTIITGSISAKNDVHTTGAVNLYLIVDGDVEGSFLRADSTSVNGKVELSKNLEAKGSVFYGTITAGTTIVDNGSTFKKDITAGDDITITGSTFASGTETNPAITSTAGDIVLTTVSGKTSTLTAVAEGKSIAIKNLEAAAVLTTGNISANNMVSVFGNSSYKVTVGSISGTSLAASYAIVTDVVDLGGAIISADSIFNAAVSADVLADTRSTFKASVFVNGNATFIDSVFASDSASILSQTGDIIMKKADNTAGVTGTVGNLTSYTGNVTINTTAALSTGKIKAGKDVSVTGSSSNKVIVRDYEGASVDAATLNTDYAVVNGTVVLTGNMTSQRSVFKDTINADAVTDTGSAFEKAIVATDDVVLTGSTFFNSAPVTSDGNITMTTVTGLAGMLKASNVTVSNYAAVADLETGAIVAVNAVAVAGHADGTYKVTVGGVAGATLDVSRSTVTGAVTLTGGMTSKLSVFGGDVSASTVSDNGSTFNDVVFTNVDGGDAVFDSSIFASENAAVTSSSGNIIMTGVTGTAGDLMSSLGCVTIDNSEATASLSTGSVEAADAVKVTGNSTYKVTAASVSGTSLNASYTNVSGTVTLTGDMLAADSVFGGIVKAGGNLESKASFFMDDVELVGDLESAGSYFHDAVSANAIDDSGSTFTGSFTITVEADASFENTVFEYSPAVIAKNGDIEMIKASGTVGALEAYDVTINNYQATATLVTGNIKAANDVSLTGAMMYRVTVDGSVRGINLNAIYATVNGNVVLTGDLTSTSVTFNGNINVATIVDTRSTFDGNCGNILSRGDVTLSGSRFGFCTTNIASFGNIEMTRVTGTAGNVRTNGGSVTIDNTQAYGTLTTGTITATGAVSVTGRLYNSANSITVAGVSGASLDVVYVTLDGEVNLTGNLNSTNSVYTVNAVVSAFAVSDTKSTVIGDITAEYDITFENSVFSDTSDIASKNGNIEMTKTTGAVGTITASAYGSDVTINNALATAEFTTGRLTAGDAVSVTGNSDHVLTVAGVSASTLVADFATFSDSINAKYEVSLTNSVFAGGKDVISSFGSIAMTKVTGTAGKLEAISVNINNAEATKVLSTKLIKTADAVTVNGNSRNYVTVAGVLSSSLDAVYASFSDDISTSGEVTISESAFTSEDADIKSSLDNIVLTKVTGTAGTLTANGVTINNADVQLQGTVETSLTTGAIEAVGDVSVTGNSKHAVAVGGVSGSALDVTYAIVTGDVKLTGDLTSSYARFSNAVALSGNLESVNTTFEGNVTAATITAERGSFIRNTNVNSTTSVTAISGDVKLTGSMLSGVNVVSRNGKIEMTNVINETLLPAAGTLKASVVTIDNAQATGSLRTGTIEAVGGDVTITGSSSHPVTVGGVTGNTLDAIYATINGAVELSGDLTSVNSSFGSNVEVSGNLTATDSAFLGAVSAAAITAERGEFKYLVTATTGDVVLTGSKFSSENAYVKSSFGNIEMTKVTGTAGSLEATNVTISNADATATLEMGEIKAVGAVDLTGNSTYGVTAAGVSGTTLETTYATVTGEVGLSGALTSTDSAFYGDVSATVITDTRSTFVDENPTESITVTATTGNVILNGSVFSGAGVTSTEGSILMTKVTGTAGALEAYSVTINNDQTSDALTTGVITSVGAVKVTGNSKYPVTVGGVTGTKLDADYAVISGAIEVATGDVTLTDSTFENKATVTATLGNITMTKVTGTAGSLTTYGDAKTITIDNSKSFATLKTGAVKSASAVPGAVTVTGNAYYGAGNVTVGAISGTTVDVAYATVTGAITASGDVTLKDSVFDTEDGVTSTADSILMTNVTGLVGNLTASATGMDITINNAEAKASLITGAITAADAVKVTGNSTYKVTAASVSGTTLETTYATVTGGVGLSGALTSTDSAFYGAVSATVITDERGKFGNGVDAAKITATTGNVILNGSVFNGAGVTSTEGSILMTKVTGTAGALTASATGMDITINNAEAKASLTTGAITADDTVTVTGNSEYPVTVTAITTAKLIVNADNDYFSATDVVASGSIAINGGTYTGTFAFSGSTASTITAGKFTGTFRHTGTAALSITGGLFTGTGQSLESGTTTIDGTYSSTGGWDVVFDNLSITGSTAIIKSGYFKAKDADQLNNIGAKISQTESSVSDSKFVDIVYAGSEIEGASSLYYTNVKKANISFNAPAVTGNMSFTYPTSVVLSGSIVLKNSTYTVVSNNRALNDASGASIVRKDSKTGDPAYCKQVGSVYTYYYAQP